MLRDLPFVELHDSGDGVCFPAIAALDEKEGRSGEPHALRYMPEREVALGSFSGEIGGDSLPLPLKLGLQLAHVLNSDHIPQDLSVSRTGNIPDNGKNTRVRESCQEGVLLVKTDWPPKEGFADRLGRLRRALSLDNAEIAKACGVATKTVSMWMGGQEPRGAALLALAKVLKVSPDWLLTGEGEAEVAPTRKPKRDFGLPKEEADRERPVVRTTSRRKRSAE